MSNDSGVCVCVRVCIVCSGVMYNIGRTVPLPISEIVDGGGPIPGRGRGTWSLLSL